MLLSLEMWGIIIARQKLKRSMYYNVVHVHACTHTWTCYTCTFAFMCTWACDICVTHPCVQYMGMHTCIYLCVCMCSHKAHFSKAVCDVWLPVDVCSCTAYVCIHTCKCDILCMFVALCNAYLVIYVFVYMTYEVVCMYLRARFSKWIFPRRFCPVTLSKQSKTELENLSHLQGRSTSGLAFSCLLKSSGIVSES